MKNLHKKALIPALVAAAVSAISLSANALPYKNDAIINEEINSAYDLLKFQEQMARGGAKDREELISRALRLKAMTDYAKSVAIRSGIKARIASIDKEIQLNSRNLDAIYDFAPLMIDGKVIPPVISEANRLYNQSSDTQVNRAEKIFKIERQAKFASTAPNWRSYLEFPVEANAFEKYAYVAGDMTPKDDIELKAWQDATIEGWNLGVSQANIILQQGMERLNRDYIGMIRFHQFVMQGKLTMPIIQQYKLYDNNTGDKMIVDEQLLRITELPSFNNQALIQSLPQHQLKPNEYVVIEDSAFIETPASIGKVFNKTVAEEPAAVANAKPNIFATPTPPPEPPKPVVTVKTDRNQGAIDSVQDILNGQDKDGEIRPTIVKPVKSAGKLAAKPVYEYQTSDGIYGSQKNSDVLLIQIKTRSANDSGVN